LQEKKKREYRAYEDGRMLAVTSTKGSSQKIIEILSELTLTLSHTMKVIMEGKRVPGNI
jgi:hypothetical protein